MLGDEPLTVTSTIRNWSSRGGGWIAWSLRQALQLLNDVRYFSESSDEALAVRLQWHTIAVTLILCLFNFYYVISLFLTLLPTLPWQAAQLAYMMEDRLKNAAEEAEKEKALKEVVEAIARGKGTAAKNAKERARVAEKA